MLIIDMPMPKYCADCPMIALSDRGMICLCTEALLEIDYDKKRPSWCPIKGELVRCGECKHRDYCDIYAHVKDADFFCKAGWMDLFRGERKDGERRNDD